MAASIPREAIALTARTTTPSVSKWEPAKRQLPPFPVLREVLIALVLHPLPEAITPRGLALASGAGIAYTQRVKSYTLGLVYRLVAAGPGDSAAEARRRRNRIGEEVFKMKALGTLLCVAMMAPVALAGLDPATDSFGVYFDTAGNTNCVTAGALQPVTTYLVLMNPVGPTDGFECSVFRTGAPHFVLSTTFNTNCGPEPDWDAPPDDYLCACPSPFPVPANGAVVLVTWSIMLQTPTELLFSVGPSSTPSLPGGLPVLTGNGVLRHGNVASGAVNLPVAAINAGNCPVSDEVNAFGAVKGLFR